MMCGAVPFLILWKIVQLIFFDSISDQFVSLIGVAIMAIFVIGGGLLYRKANKLSPIIKTQATVTEKKVKVGHPNEYIVRLVRDNGETFSSIWDKQLYDAVDVGDSGLLATQGDALIRFGEKINRSE